MISKHQSKTATQDEAAVLVVAACGLVREPGPAVGEPRWALSDGSAPDLTLAEILAERAAAKFASDRWLYERDVVQRQRNMIDALRVLVGGLIWLTGLAVIALLKPSGSSSTASRSPS